MAAFRMLERIYGQAATADRTDLSGGGCRGALASRYGLMVICSLILMRYETTCGPQICVERIKQD